MAGSQVHWQRVSWNGNLLRAGLCLLVIGMSASCASLSSPGNSAGVCSEMKPSGKGWAYEANKYLIKSVFRNDYVDENGVVSVGSQLKCDTIDREWHTVVEGEYALTVANNIVFMTTSENICRSRPTIKVHRFIEHVWPAKFEARLRARESSSQIEPYAELTRPFYVGTHNAEWIRRPNGIEKNLLFIKELIAKQCGNIPKEIRISGRYTELPQRDPKSKALLNTYASHEIYTGTYYPHVNSNAGPEAPPHLRMKIVPDDNKMASAHYSLVVAEREQNQERFLAARKALIERLKSSPQAEAIMGIVLLGLLAIPQPCEREPQPYYCN